MKLPKSSSNNISISFFFPAYNEEATVEPLVHQAEAVLGGITDDYEILIVDDGSTDRTTEIGAHLMRESAHTRLIHHSGNRGYGAALRSGVEHSTKKLIFFTDGDLQFDVGELKQLLPYLENADIVAGYRIKRADSLHRILVSSVFNFLCRHLYRLQVRDVNCAFKLYRREVFESMELKSSRGLINAEILVKALRAGYRIKQVGVHHYPRKNGMSRARVREIFSTVVQMIQMHRELRGES